MCSPQIAVMGAAATFNAVGTYNKAKAERGALQFSAGIDELNAQAADWQAKDALVRGEIATREVRRKGEQVAGMQRAVFAGRGLSLTEGSPLAILDETAYFTELDAATTRSNAEKEAWGSRVRATSLRTQAALTRYRADSINPIFDTVGAALGGAGQVASVWSSGKR